MWWALLFTFAAVFASSSALADAQEDCEKKSGEVAIRGCTELIRRNPKDARAYNNRGAEYKAKGETDRAITDYTKAIKINPQLAEAYYNRGASWEKKGDKRKAIADYRQTLAINASDNHAIAALKRLGASQ